MKETLYTETLARAAEAEGGTAALARMLNVPENTLARWMSGRAQTPLRAFLKVLERLSAHELSAGERRAVPAGQSAGAAAADRRARVPHAHTMTAARKRRYGVLTPSSRKKPAVSG